MSVWTNLKDGKTPVVLLVTRHEPVSNQEIDICWNRIIVILLWNISKWGGIKIENEINRLLTLDQLQTQQHLRAQNESCESKNEPWPWKRHTCMLDSSCSSPCRRCCHSGSRSGRIWGAKRLFWEGDRRLEREGEGLILEEYVKWVSGKKVWKGSCYISLPGQYRRLERSGFLSPSHYCIHLPIPFTATCSWTCEAVAPRIGP